MFGKTRCFSGARPSGSGRKISATGADHGEAAVRVVFRRGPREPVGGGLYLIWATAQAACSRTSGSGSLRAASNAGSAARSPMLPRATQTLRSQPRRLSRSMGVPRKKARNCASSHDKNSVNDGRSVRGWNSATGDARAKRFQGQTSRQSSQPNTRSPIRGRSSTGIEPLSSIVR